MTSVNAHSSDLFSHSAVDTVRVTICIATRCRPDGLERVLQGIRELQLPSDVAVRVVVVDNDPEGSARSYCDEIAASYPWPFRYVKESRQGIPFARNRALDVALSDSDFVAFIDDDEVPAPDWIAKLLHGLRVYSADVVLGPVPPYFLEPVPEWITRGKFFVREQHPSGMVCKTGHGGTGNALVSSQALRQSGIRFDESFGLCGGSDSDFFRQLQQSGYRVVWCDEAIATEWQPRSRATIQWLMMRHFRNGCTAWRFSGANSVKVLLKLVAEGVARVIVGGVCAVLFLPLGKHRSVKAIRWASYGVGLIAGITGKQVEEYRKAGSV